MSLWVRTDWREVVIEVKGRVNSEHVEYLQERLLNCLREGYRKMKVSLCEVEMMDRSCEKMLQEFERLLAARGGRLTVEF